MMDKIGVYSEYLMPTFVYRWFSKKIGNSKINWLKNFLINHFIKKHNISLKELVISNPKDYPSFNSFFIREITDQAKGASKPNEISSPAESTITEFGTIKTDTLIQAKKIEFKLEEFLIYEKFYIEKFKDGKYMIFYLDTFNYHRYHMPMDGKLEYSMYIPCSSFELDYTTQKTLPGLYCKNERWVGFFDTKIGKIAIVLIGGMYVGGIQLSWMKTPFASKQVIRKRHENRFLKKDQELGHFQYGSTIVCLFEKDKIQWKRNLKRCLPIKVSSAIAIPK